MPLDFNPVNPGQFTRRVYAYPEQSAITYQYQYRFFGSVNSGNYYISPTYHICDPSQQNRAVVCYQEKCDISFYLKEHFMNSKMIPLMCKLDAALHFYDQK